MNNLNIELNPNKEVKDMNEVKVLKLVHRGCYHIYKNDVGQYIVGINKGQPFVIPIEKILKREHNKIWYIPAPENRPKTRFLLISDGSYKGASIVDFDNIKIIYTSEHKNTNIKNHTILEKQIELNALFLASRPTLAKEIIRENIIIRIIRVGLIAMTKKFVYINDYSNNKDYYPDLQQFDFRQYHTNHDTFIEFEEKEKCFVIKNWHKIEFI